MVNAETARTVVGIIGIVISVGLFLSPVPTFWRIWKKKDVEEFQPYPYLAVMINCMLWGFYGTPNPNTVLVATIGTVGLVLETIYIALFGFYDRQYKVNGLTRYYFLPGVGGLLFYIIINQFHINFHSRNIPVAVIAVMFNIIMYASPFAVMGQVVRTKSVEFMPLWLSVALFAHGAIWTSYALIHGINWFILVSNGLGTIFAVVQLGFYAYYATRYGGANKKAAAAEAKPEIQQSDVTSTVDYHYANHCQC